MKTYTTHLKLIVSILLPLLILALPLNTIPIVGLTIVEQRMLAILVMAVLFWILEPVPIFATSILIITAELLLISNKGLIWLRTESLLAKDNFGELLNYKEVMASFASPIIILFLGGFFLAMAASKYKLDRNLARVLLKPFGSQTKFLMLGMMIVTAVFSMFMSNTATTAMMLAILAPVLPFFPDNDPAKKAFLLSIPMAANVGGIGTPIGTPPNAVAMKYLTGPTAISFSDWMSFGIPFVIVLLTISWILLLALFPANQKTMKVVIKGQFLKSWQAIVVYVTFLSTIILWLSGRLHGMSSYVVAIIPVATFVLTQIITKEDLKKLNWDVLWLISGGIALGLGMQKTGLSAHLIDSIPFQDLAPMAIIVISSLIALIMATLMSNTATANLLLPIMAALGSNIDALTNLGGSKMLILIVALTCSMGMALPISTPPNALAFASGKIATKDLFKAGGIISVIGVLMIFALSFVLLKVNFYSLP